MDVNVRFLWVETLFRRKSGDLLKFPDYPSSDNPTYLELLRKKYVTLFYLTRQYMQHTSPILRFDIHMAMLKTSRPPSVLYHIHKLYHYTNYIPTTQYECFTIQRLIHGFIYVLTYRHLSGFIGVWLDEIFNRFSSNLGHECVWIF